MNLSLSEASPMNAAFTVKNGITGRICARKRAKGAGRREPGVMASGGVLPRHGFACLPYVDGKLKEVMEEDFTTGGAWLSGASKKKRDVFMPWKYGDASPS